jgi:hypothetical protein
MRKNKKEEKIFEVKETGAKEEGSRNLGIENKKNLS